MFFFDDILTVIGIGELINNTFGEQAILRNEVTEEQKIALIMDMKKCSKEDAYRYFKAYNDYHQNDGSLTSSVDISHRPDESKPFEAVPVPDPKPANTTPVDKT